MYYTLVLSSLSTHYLRTMLLLFVSSVLRGDVSPRSLVDSNEIIQQSAWLWIPSRMSAVSNEMNPLRSVSEKMELPLQDRRK